MVVQGLIALALALPTGMLFGVGYGTGVRIGYEQVYPLLFPKTTGDQPNATQVKDNLKQINSIYNTIGGKEASNMGIAQGINSVREATENNPDFRYLEELELKLSGLTQSSSNQTPTVNFDSTTSSALQESYSKFEIEQANLARQITDIPQLLRFIAREQERTIPSAYVIATAKARINKLRGSITVETIQEKQQRELDERKPIIAPKREPTTQESAISKYVLRLGTLQAEALVIKRRRDDLVRVGATQDDRYRSQFVQPWINKLKNKVKEILNHISLSRNNPLLKARASSDFAKKVWTLSQ